MAGPEGDASNPGPGLSRFGTARGGEQMETGGPFSRTASKQLNSSRTLNQRPSANRWGNDGIRYLPHDETGGVQYIISVVETLYLCHGAMFSNRHTKA